MLIAISTVPGRTWLVTCRRGVSFLQVHRLRSVDNLFVVVQEFKDYQFKDNKVSDHVSPPLWILGCFV